MESRASWRMFCGHYGEQGQLENVLWALWRAGPAGKCFVRRAEEMKLSFGVSVRMEGGRGEAGRKEGRKEVDEDSGALRFILRRVILKAVWCSVVCSVTVGS